MKEYKKTATALAMVIFVVIICISILTSIFQIDIYSKSQKENDVAIKMNISEDDLAQATMVSLLYTKGHLSELAYVIEGQDLFSTQDKEHMIDVKNLYVGLYNTFFTASIIMFAILVFAFIKHKSINFTLFFKEINKTLLYSLIFVAFIAIFAYVNFSVFWVYFHKVFFSNDLWLMNPSVDALVNLFPEQLFMDLVFYIIKRFTFIFITLNLFIYGYYKYSLKRITND